jgi:hypothetical protein
MTENVRRLKAPAGTRELSVDKSVIPFVAVGRERMRGDTKARETIDKQVGAHAS